MEQDNYQYLKDHYEKEQAAMRKRIEEQEYAKLARNGHPVTFEAFKEKGKQNIDALMTERSPQLEKEIFKDFGGSQEAARQQMERQRLRDQERQKLIEAEKQKQARMQKQKEETPKGEPPRRQFNDQAATPEQEKQNRLKQWEQLRTQLRGQYREASKEKNHLGKER